MTAAKSTAASRWGAIFPDTELLKQWQGVEEGLRRGRSLGRLGWAGALAAAILQVAVSVLDSSWLEKLQNLDTNVLKDNLYLALPLVAGVVFLLLYRWSRYWLHESEQPFRYTCSIEPFAPVHESMSDPKLQWMSHHLMRQMNERIGRLRFSEEPKSGAQESSSHVHVRGHYLFRENAEGNWLLEVFIRVRVGGADRPETLAHRVEFLLDRPPVGESPAGAGSAAQESRLSVAEYELLLERVHFGAASEIYRQIREDVSKKLELLPGHRFKAVALFHEAEDYARSSTLDAYEEARALYERCAHLLDPALGPLPEQPLRRRLARVLRALQAWHAALRRIESRVRPSLARADVLCARAELGYATMLLQGSVIAAIAGQRRRRAVFEAPAVARRAIARLEAATADATDRPAALYRGYVILAWARHAVDDQRAAEKDLAMAYALSPALAEQDGLYHMVAGLLVPPPWQSIEKLSRAHELQPAFEASAFTLALMKEYLWRSRPDFEPQGAGEVIRLYSNLVKTNPGLIGVWANRGYLQWLIAMPDKPLRPQLEKAKRSFANGRQYKEIKQATFVAELDYGLARIAAELDEFETAQLHCTEIASSMFSSGMEFANYYFDYIGLDMVRRFEQYHERVEAHWRRRRDAASAAPRRVDDCVLAFVLNDCAEAYQQYSWRAGDERYLSKAREALNRAAVLDPAFPGVHLSLARLERYANDGAAVKHLRRCLELSPQWPQAICEMAAAQGRRVCELEKQAAEALGSQSKSLQKSRKAKEEAREAEKRIRDAALSLERTGELAELENKARELRKEATRLLREAWNARREARELRRDAKDAEREVRTHAARLLPHPWLWRQGGKKGERELDWTAFGRWDLEEGLRWERELGEWSAVALMVYVESLVMRTASNGNSSSPVAPRDLLAFLRRHFWPNRVESIRALQRADPRLSNEDEEALRTVIQGWVAADPCNDNILRGWLTNPVMETEAPEVLRRTVERSDAASATLIWAAAALHERGESQGAVQACLAALHREDLDAQSLRAVAEQLEELAQWREARDAWQKLLRLIPGRDPAWARATVGCAVASWRTGETALALRSLQELAAGDQQLEGWRHDFVNRIDLAHVPRDERSLLRCWLEYQLRATQGDARSDAAQALLQMAGTLSWASVHSDVPEQDSTPLLPVVTPIVLEGDEALFDDEARAVLARIEPMRGSIREELGVVLPGVRVRANATDLSPNRYFLAVDEAQVAMGRVYPGCFVCPDWPPDRPPPVASWRHVFNPLSGRDDALVVPSEERSAMEQHTLWDQWEYMVRHLEFVVRRHVRHFFGPQELHELIESWTWRSAGRGYDESAERAERIARALPDAAARAALLCALQELLRQHVGIGDVAAILDAFEQHYRSDGEPSALTEAVRKRLPRPKLGATPSVVRLAPELEHAVATDLFSQDGRLVFLPTAAAGLCKRIREAVKDLLDPVLVVETASVRPLLARLVRDDFPRMPVLAVRELPRNLRRECSATVSAS